MNKLAPRWNPSFSISASWVRKVACMAALTPLLATQSPAQTAPFDHRSAGMVFDAFTFDGGEFWTVEDGGRIRHRWSATGTPHFQVVPSDVKDTLRRIHFVPDQTYWDGPTGWAVGEWGWLIKTDTGGSTWSIIDLDPGAGQQMPAVLLPGPTDLWPDKESLWDVHFLDENRGWLCGLHGIWRTVDGGANWIPCTVKMQDDRVIFPLSVPPDPISLDILKDTEFYALDVIERPNPDQPGTMELIGMVAAEPGLVFRTKNGTDWKVVLDIRCLCVQQAQGCATSPQGCSECYDDCTSLPEIDGCLMQPGNRLGEAKICGDLEHFEAWDIDISGDQDRADSFAVMVGGIGHGWGMVFTSEDDGVHWKKEPHECHLGGAGGAPNCTNPLNYAYNDVPPGHANYYTHTYRTKEWGALYGVAIFDGDNSAILSGYGGSVAYRTPTEAIWRDVSEYNARIDEVPNAVTSPLMGAAASQTGSFTTGKGFIVGMGGIIREKDPGTTGWGDATGTVHGTPWRLRDIYFLDATTGFQVGQLCRIAKTTDSGTNWNHDLNPPLFDPAGTPGGFSGGTLHAVTFASGTPSGRGVTVGGKPSELDPNLPAIYYTKDAGATAWKKAVGFTLAGQPAAVADGLFDVTFAGWTPTSKADYWAAGGKGFMLHSSDDGRTWTQFVPTTGQGGQPTDIKISGVAFKDIDTGIFVGTNDPYPPGGPTHAWAFQWKQGNPPSWTNVSPPVSPPATYNVVAFSDVVIAGTTAYAVGEKIIGGVRSGVVMTSSFSSGNFGTFTVLSGTPAFPLCVSNESADDWDTTPVLTEVEIHPTTGEMWVGGQCGRVWSRINGTWSTIPYQSQTDTNILGISFAGSSVYRYFTGHRVDFPQANVVRYTGQ